MLIPARSMLTEVLRRHRCLGLDHELQSRVALHMEGGMDAGQGRLLVLSVCVSSFTLFPVS